MGLRMIYCHYGSYVDQDDCEIPEGCSVDPAEVFDPADKPKTKRKRRTKAEIEASKAKK
jgi:hypothetical protein